MPLETQKSVIDYSTGFVEGQGSYSQIKRKMGEALETNELKTLNEADKKFKVLNKNNSEYITKNSWRLSS